MKDPQNLNLKQIKALLEGFVQKKEYPEKFILQLKSDERRGVKKLCQNFEHKKGSLVLKYQHLEELTNFDRKFLVEVAGIDEAGRGPLAGPVVAAAVCLDLDNLHWALGLDDSKKLKREERKIFYNLIQQNALSIGIGIIEPLIIDEINILQATALAMQKAVQSLSKENLLLLVDGLFVPLLGKNQVATVKGDAKSISIAAASIMAKETRDRIMERLDLIYPKYGFASNKGYGTKEHLKNLLEFGPTPVHRQSFIKNLSAKQGSLF